MRKNFSFKLTGKDLLGLYILFLLFYIIPLTYFMLIGNKQNEEPNPIYILVYFIFLILSSIAVYLLITPLLKKVLGGIFIDEDKVVYQGKMSKFFWLNIGGNILSMITFGIYAPWYVKKAYKYILSNTNFKNKHFSFDGKASILLAIVVLSLFIPMIILMILVTVVFKFDTTSIKYQLVMQPTMYLIMIPYLYLTYKWLANIEHGNKTIRWRTTFFSSCKVLYKEWLFALLTIGIYSPIAWANIYRYFIRNTVIETEGQIIYNLDTSIENRIIFIQTWKYFFLTLLTIGFYTPWAYVNLTKLYLNNSYIQKQK